MIESTYEIKSATKGALLRLFNSRVDGGVRPLVDHHHTMCEISLIKKGRGVYTVGDKRIELASGDIFVFAGDEPHCITELDGELRIMNVHFEPRFIWSPGNGMFDAKYLRIFHERPPEAPRRVERDLPDRGEMVELLLSMEREFETAHPEYELMVKIRLLTLLVLLGRSLGIETRDDEVRTPKLQALDRAMDYISENLASELSLDELAREAGMSRSHFSTTFKQLNGITPWEYITAKRVERALELLRGGELTVLEVAVQSGFNSTANFNRAIRKMTGLSPSQIRRGTTE